MTIQKTDLIEKIDALFNHHSSQSFSLDDLETPEFRQKYGKILKPKGDIVEAKAIITGETGHLWWRRPVTDLFLFRHNRAYSTVCTNERDIRRPNDTYFVDRCKLIRFSGEVKEAFTSEFYPNVGKIGRIIPHTHNAVEGKIDRAHEFHVGR